MANDLSSIIIYIFRGGTVHVFEPNRHGTDLSVQCMRPYDDYRQFTPNPEGAPAVMQRRLITASRKTANDVSCVLENKAHYTVTMAASENLGCCLDAL